MNDQYNELMKQIIRAEYDFNNALANAFKPFVEMVNNKEKCMKQKRDESYLKGAEDMLEANRLLIDFRKNGGMSCNDMARIFGSTNSSYIILHKSAEEILNGVDQWKKEKPEEVKFEVGDEVECVGTYNMNRGKKCVVLSVREEMKLYDLRNYTTYWTNNFVDYRKTGKHYYAIPISTEGEDK